MKVLDRYIGKKNEIIFKNQDRNYLYHINAIPEKNNMWSIIPGKFTLAFSLAPEFYRIVYKKNPRKVFRTFLDECKFSHLIAETVWRELQN